LEADAALRRLERGANRAACQHPGMTQSTPIVEWCAQSIECADPEAMAEFYIGLMGGRVTHRKPDWTGVEAGGLRLNFHRAAGHRPPTWPSMDVPMQHHFDLVVKDLDAAISQAQRLGARLADFQDEDDPDYMVLLDPSGHPFCLISARVAVGP
jgi:catechol 2,3-dioxygenase-like lactoylglutathione lyase family enzyme